MQLKTDNLPRENDRLSASGNATPFYELKPIIDPGIIRTGSYRMPS
jgi:hypothetical protein